MSELKDYPERRFVLCETWRASESDDFCVVALGSDDQVIETFERSRARDVDPRADLPVCELLPVEHVDLLRDLVAETVRLKANEDDDCSRVFAALDALPAALLKSCEP